MNARIFHSIFRVLAALGILLSFFVSPLSNAQAQTGDQPGQSYEITFEQMGYEEETLQDPYGAANYYFTLPVDWQPLAGTYVELHLGYWFASAQNQSMAELSVRLNDTLLWSQKLDTQGEMTVRVDLPPELLYLSSNENSINTLEVAFEAYGMCNEDSLGVQALLSIHNSSFLHFEYSLQPLAVNLAQFPKPLYYENAFTTDPTTFVLPDQPTAADLEAAMVISARLGKLTNYKLPLQVVSAASWHPVTSEAGNLVVIGKPEANTAIEKLTLPAALQKRSLGLSSTLPNKVTVSQPFTLTLTVTNTSQGVQNLIVSDRLPLGATLKGCSTKCQQADPAHYQWVVGDLQAGQMASNQVQIELDAASFPFGTHFEHTASLFNNQKELLNVDSLSTLVDGQADISQSVSSSQEKGNYFFAGNGDAVAESDGLVQELVSPRYPSKGILVVTGLSDDAVRKASQGLGTKTQFPGMEGQVALVEENLPYTTTEVTGNQFTFQSLGYSDRQVGAYQGSMQVKFDIPHGWTISDDASLFLHYAYSAAMKTLTGTLEVDLNGIAVNSILLDKQANLNLWDQLSLPKNKFQEGSNTLTLRVIADFPHCTTIQLLESFWLSIFADSFLNLPHSIEVTAFDLKTFPQPFANKSDLSDLAFALPERMDTTQVEDLLRLAEFLGYSANGDGFQPRVVVGGDPTKDPLDAYHIIAFGRPTENGYIAAANEALAQPFVPGTDTIIQKVDSIVYRLPDTYNMGFIQLLSSPWNGDKALLAITGSTTTGVNWAVNGLLDDKLNYRLKGNLGLLMKADDLRATDTRVIQAGQSLIPTMAQVMVPQNPAGPGVAQPTVTPTPAAIAQAQPVQPAQPTQPLPTGTAVKAPGGSSLAQQIAIRPVWHLPLMIASALIVILIAVLVIFRRS